MKTKVSAFEYAIAEAVKDKEFLEAHSPRTRAEENEHRVNDIKSQAKKLRIAHVSNSVCECDIPYFPTGNIDWCSKCNCKSAYSD